MLGDKKADLTRELIEEGKIKTFEDIFMYVPKTYLADKMGMNYKRFVRLTLNSEKMKYRETYSLARVLKVDPRRISELIHNGIDYQKKAKKRN